MKDISVTIHCASMFMRERECGRGEKINICGSYADTVTSEGDRILSSVMCAYKALSNSIPCHDFRPEKWQCDLTNAHRFCKALKVYLGQTLN